MPMCTHALAVPPCVEIRQQHSVVAELAALIPEGTLLQHNHCKDVEQSNAHSGNIGILLYVLFADLFLRLMAT
jgi:hypothetical protein